MLELAYLSKTKIFENSGKIRNFHKTQPFSIVFWVLLMRRLWKKINIHLNRKNKFLMKNTKTMKNRASDLLKGIAEFCILIKFLWESHQKFWMQNLNPLLGGFILFPVSCKNAIKYILWKDYGGYGPWPVWYGIYFWISQNVEK